MDYYEETKYPLAVKLGTITPDGADVYSYDEDNMVEDPKLSEHLAHFGIDITSMTKVGETASKKFCVSERKLIMGRVEESLKDKIIIGLKKGIIA